MTHIGDVRAEGQRLSTELERAIPTLRLLVSDTAEKERAYRHSKAEEYVKVRVLDELKYASERTAWVDAVTAEKRMDRDIAEGMKVAQLELIRNLRQQLSFCQTSLNAYKEDQAFHRHGQQSTPPDLSPDEMEREIPF